MAQLWRGSSVESYLGIWFFVTEQMIYNFQGFSKQLFLSKSRF